MIAATYGKGTFDFYERDRRGSGKKIGSDVGEIELRGLLSLFEYAEVKLDFLIGLRVHKVFVPGFEYNGRIYTDNEVSDTFLNVNTGFGIRY